MDHDRRPMQRVEPRGTMADVRPPASRAAQAAINAQQAYSDSVRIAPAAPAVNDLPPPVPQPAPPLPEPQPALDAGHDDQPDPKKKTHKQAKKKPARRRRLLAVAAALAVGGILSAAAVFIYMRTNDAAVPGDGADTTGASADTADQPENIDQVISDIDATLKGIDVQKDFPKDELSDEVLGL